MRTLVALLLLLLPVAVVSGCDSTSSSESSLEDEWKDVYDSYNDSTNDGHISRNEKDNIMNEWNDLP